MAEPVRFADGTIRCADCRGYGVVKRFGGNRFGASAQARRAIAQGGARECLVCEGSGLLRHVTTLRVIGLYGLDWGQVLADKQRRGVRCAVEDSRLVRARIKGAMSTDAPPF